MSRIVKRVPLDFDWPMNVIWPGYMLLSIEDVVYSVNAKGHDSDTLYETFTRIVPSQERSQVLDQIEVPKGDGWQMWEDVSEGSPISPVFATPEKLAQWLADNNAPASGSMTATYDEWLGMINHGWACSIVVIDGVTKSGVADSAESGGTDGVS